MKQDATPFSKKRLLVAEHNQKLPMSDSNNLFIEWKRIIFLLCLLGLCFETVNPLGLYFPFEFSNVVQILLIQVAVAESFLKLLSGSWNAVFKARFDLSLMLVGNGCKLFIELASSLALIVQYSQNQQWSNEPVERNQDSRSKRQRHQ